MYKGLDSAQSLIDYAGTLKLEGYSFVGRYYFNQSSYKQRLESPEAAHLSTQGIKLVAIWESGYPIGPDYFTDTQGQADGLHAAQQAQAACQPKNTPIYFAADYDSNPSEITPYAQAFQKEVKAAGYVAGIYGNGITCKALKEAGIVSYTWLSQSTGYQGYQEWLPNADIIQTQQFTWHDFAVDGDEAGENSGSWLVA